MRPASTFSVTSSEFAGRGLHPFLRSVWIGAIALRPPALFPAHAGTTSSAASHNSAWSAVYPQSPPSNPFAPSPPPAPAGIPAIQKALRSPERPRSADRAPLPPIRSRTSARIGGPAFRITPLVAEKFRSSGSRIPPEDRVVPALFLAAPLTAGSRAPLSPWVNRSDVSARPPPGRAAPKCRVADASFPSIAPSVLRFAPATATVHPTALLDRIPFRPRRSAPFLGPRFRRSSLAPSGNNLQP